MDGDLWSALLARPPELFVRTFSDGDGCVQPETRVCAMLGALGIALCWLLSDGGIWSLVLHVVACAP
jgi:hypothetical protein